MFKISLKNLFAHKARMLLTIFSIVLGVSFVAGTYIFTDSIGGSFKTIFDDVYSSVDVTVRASEDQVLGPDGRPADTSDDDSSEPTFDKGVESVVSEIDGVRVFESEISETAFILDAEGEVYGQSGPPKIGISWIVEPSLNIAKIREGNGRPPVAPGEVVIDTYSAESLDKVIGDKVEIFGGKAKEEFEIVGLLSFGDDAASLGGITVAAFEFEEARRFLDFGNNVTAININAEDGVDVEELRDRVAKALPDGLEAVTGDQQADEQLDEITEALGFLNIALLAFAGAAVFVSSFIIQNTFRIVLAQRAREMALLRAVGASKFQIIRSVLFEAIIIGLVASVIGIIVGFGVSKVLAFILEKADIGLPNSELVIANRTIIVSMLVGVVITLLSALLPAIKSSRTPPIEAMKSSEGGAKNKKSLRLRIVFGIILTAIGALLLWLGLTDKIDSLNPLYSVGLGVVVSFLGVSTLSPILSIPLIWILSWPISMIFRTTGNLARGNTQRTPRRTASTASALMIGISLVTFVAVFAASIKGTIGDILAESFPADLTITQSLPNTGPIPEVGVSNQFVQKLEENPGITDVTRSQYQEAEINGSTDFIIGVDTDTFNKVILLKPTVDYSVLDELDTVILNQTYLEDNELFVGGIMEIDFPSTTKSLKIVGSFEEAYDSRILMSIDTINQYYSDNTNSAVFANFAQDVDQEVVRRELDVVDKEDPSVKVQDSSEFVKDAEKQIDGILALFWGLLGMALFIAILGIANTLTLSIYERTKEVGLLRAVGMTKNQVRTTIRLEAILISVFGSVLGILMGIFFGWALLKALESQGLTGFVIPWFQLAIYLALAILAALLAAFFPSRKASNVDVLEAISRE